MTLASSTFFWITSRAAGTTAMVLASVAVGFGLTMGGKLIRAGAPERRAIHEILALSTLVAIAVHGLALLGDSWLHPSLADVAVPFLAPYRTLYTSLGIIAGWALVVLGLSFYARRRIGAARWRSIHRLTALAWLLALVHTFTVGSDAGKPWFIALILLTAAPVLILLVIRHVGPERPTRRVKPGGLSVRPA
jgi:methionine sulfoxide reductase heme-binding subunit